MSVEQHAQELYNALVEKGAKDVKLEDIKAELQQFIDKYMLDEENAAETLKTRLCKLYNVSAKGTSKVMSIAEALKAGEEKAKSNANTGEKNGVFVTVRAKVVSIFPSKNDGRQQVCRIADETASTILTVWERKPYKNGKDANQPVTQLPLLEEEKSYEFRNIVTSEWQGNITLKTTGKVTEFAEVEDDIEVKIGEQEILAPVVAIFDDSGLIRRCTVSVEDDKSDVGVKKCGRAYKEGVCPVHGKQTNEFDISVRGVLDDGHRTQSFVLNAALSKQLTGMTVESAKTIIGDNPDAPEMVVEEIRKCLMHRYFLMKGFVTARGVMYVKEVTAAPKTADVPAMKAKLEAI
jgi:ssDNA-binding replication factor A large subunit